MGLRQIGGADRSLRRSTNPRPFDARGIEEAVDHQYSRVSNPTVSELEARLGALEDAPPGVCSASGLVAETALVLATCRAGSHVVCSQAAYGGTIQLLAEVLAERCLIEQRR